MCEFYYDPNKGQIVNGLNLVGNSLVLPHHNTFGKSWAGRLLEISRVTLIGIDEQTGILDDGSGKAWSVLGSGSVTLYRNGQEEAHPTGDSFSL
jgi:cyanophycinase-like exopeptidase